MADEQQIAGEAEAPQHADWRAELRAAWQAMPRKRVFFALLAGWLALFQFVGNSTLGYVNTSSLAGWWLWCYTGGLEKAAGNPLAILDSEESLALFAPFIVLGLFWWKRALFLALPKRIWWPAMGLLVLALGLHVMGYMVQQTRISLVAFFLGVYALMGWVWGPRWLRASFFPFLLFGLCMPLGSQAEYITFPLRMLATRITAVLSDVVLGINVVQDGTRLFDASGTYQFEVAAACSGIRSLTATLALAIVYGFATFNTAWRKWVMVLAAFPLAVAANVFRLSIIIIAAEAFGQHAGTYVHESGWFSLAPYIPAIVGIVVLGHWLREDKPSKPVGVQAPLVSAEGKPHSVHSVP